VVVHRPTAWPVGPGDLGPLVVAVQQRLLWLGAPIRPTHVMDGATVAAVSAFRAKFGTGAGTTVTASVYRRLDAVSRARGALPRSCRTTGLVLCIDKTQMSLRLVSRGRVLATADARFGSVGTPTREGVFRVYRKSRDHVSTLYRSAMPYSLFFSGGQAVHYSAYFRRDGYAGRSHGCINLRDLRFAATLFARTPVGTRVVVYRS
jgi:peptidoglycan hydrolase-like protein with peptidoglycan-binding domain